MDIRFCDLCNESVPEQDLGSGQAFLRKGRVICASCDRAMGGHGAAGMPPAPPRPPHRGGPTSEEVAASLRPALATAGHGESPHGGGGRRTATLALVLGVGAVTAVGFGGSLLLERLDALQGRQVESRIRHDQSQRSARVEQASALDPLRRRMNEVEGAALAASREAQRNAEERVAELEAKLEGSAQSERDLRASLDETRLQLATLRADMAEAREATAASMAKMEQVMAYHGDKLIELQEHIRTAGVLASRGGGTDPAVAAAQSPSWERYLIDLKSPDEGMRLEAVFALADTKDKAVVQHVIPMLKDPDIFVRMVAAQALDDLRAKTAVPALIDALDDERSPVREAAVIALRNITSQSFGYDPAGRDADRKKRVDKWRTWWRRSGDDFLTS